MLVGWGGNNGSTFTASLLANKAGLAWETKRGLQKSNYFGSMLLSSTVKIGVDPATLQDVHVPFNELLPMSHPTEWIVGGWDINSANLAQAMQRAQVLEPDLQKQLWKDMELLKPLPSIYYSDFIAGNQSARADNVLLGSKSDHLKQIRQDIR
jgi:myo-inositol-1-phosphate synthase